MLMHTFSGQHPIVWEIIYKLLMVIKCDDEMTILDFTFIIIARSLIMTVDDDGNIITKKAKQT